MLGRRVGGSTGTNLWGAFALIAEMRAAGEPGSVVTLLCDGGERYIDTYYSDAWWPSTGSTSLRTWRPIDRFLATGVL